jgi:adenylate kinase family enzyme
MFAGVIINGFPFNSAQALLFDRSVNGVNLVIHAKSGDSASQNFASLLQYYNERGSLIEIEYKDDLIEEEL